jgi:hypothetical protein
MTPWPQSDGVGVSLQKVVCSSCSRDLGAAVCRPALINLVALEVCPSCAVSSATAGRDRPSLVLGERLEGVGPLTCGARADAGSPAPSLPGNKSLGTIEAASAPGQERARVTGTMTPAGSPVAAKRASAVLEHLSHGPAASFSFSARPLFWCVTGYDFKRSNDWARRQGNSVADSIRTKNKENKR